MDYFEHYCEIFGIDKKKAVAKAVYLSDNGIRTAMKEMIGEGIIKKYNLFNVIFPDNIGYKKVTSKKLQKCGCDYQIFFQDKKSVFIDLKSLVGNDYDMVDKDYRDGGHHEHDENTKGIALEIYQNGIFTNVNKLTDYFLYTICDKDGISYCLISYKKVFDVCKKYIIHMGVVPINEFTMYKSNNNTGLYIKYPVHVKRIESDATTKKVKKIKKETV